MFTDLYRLVDKVSDIVLKPIEAVVEVLADGVGAVADVVSDLADDIKSITK